MNVLVFNVGSTTLKHALIDSQTGTRVVLPGMSGLLDRIGQPGGDAADHLSAAHLVLDQTQRAAAAIGQSIDAIGHRVVQGGQHFTAPTVVTDDVLVELRQLDTLAPLHNPPARRVIEAIAGMASSVEPAQVRQVMVFDTAYFATLPPTAYRYAIPEKLYRDHGIRRYGAHGTSHQFVVDHAIKYLSACENKIASPMKIVSLHLGGGCSATASIDGVAVDTSMGMTPLEGLVMATRSGDVDPSIPLHLMTRLGMSAADVDTMLNRQSGLLGLCGDVDMRTILHRCDAGDQAARLAIDVYAHRLIKTIGGYVAILGGLDALVFTAGVGENAASIRQRVVDSLSHFGLRIDTLLNEGKLPLEGAVDLSSPDARARTLVVRTNEELAIARQVACLSNAAEFRP